MDFIIGLIILIGSIISFKYIRAFFIRLIFMFKLKKRCANNNAKLYSNSLLWLLGMTPHNGCDFYVETEKKVFSVKFFFTRYKRDVITFIGSSQFFWGWLRIESPTRPVEVKHRIHKLPTIDFLYNMRNDFAGKPIMPYLLISPACSHIFLIPHLGATEFEVKRIGELQFIDYFTIISQHKLLEMIE
ncbi:MAG: hypothetical protein IJK34_00110 [Clostridia bacterium]|nr:hypothetical protein [Clostridia bacterium]